MSLSCECPDFEPDPGDIFLMGASDFTTLKTSKRKRCTSCKELIDINAICVEVERAHNPGEFELNIYNEDEFIKNASHYMCEECGGIYFNLEELGFCVSPYEKMTETLKEYLHEYLPQNNEVSKMLNRKSR